MAIFGRSYPPPGRAMGWFNNRSVTIGLAFIRPSADSVDGGWTNESGSAVNLFASIDEAAPADDSDYIKSGLGPVADIVRLKLQTPSNPQAPFTIYYRYRKSGAGVVDLTVRLKQGAGTTIASTVVSNIPKTLTDGSFQLTPAEFASITVFSDLYIEFQAN